MLAISVATTGKNLTGRDLLRKRGPLLSGQDRVQLCHRVETMRLVVWTLRKQLGPRTNVGIPELRAREGFCQRPVGGGQVRALSSVASFGPGEDRLHLLSLRVRTRDRVANLRAGTVVGSVALAVPTMSSLFGRFEFVEVVFGVKLGQTGFGWVLGFAIAGRQGQRCKEQGGSFHRSVLSAL